MISHGDIQYQQLQPQVNMHRCILLNQGYKWLIYWLLTIVLNLHQKILTSNEVSNDRSTGCSISSSIYWSDSEHVYHTSVGAIVDELRDVGIVAQNNVRGLIHSDVNTIPDVRVNTSYVQTRWSLPSEVDSINSIFTFEVAHSIK